MSPLFKPKNPQMGNEADMKEGKPEKGGSLAIAFSAAKHARKKKKPVPMAEGGEVYPTDLMEDEERAESIADAIMQKRRKLADGGMVDLEENSEEKPNEYDNLNALAGDAEQYDDSQISSQPMNSNESGDSREDDSENKMDMISRIRAKMRMKSGA